MTSTELKEALNRRLKKFETAGGKVHEDPHRESQDSSLEATGVKSPDEKEMNQLYRSGWNAPAPIPRSSVLPAPPPVVAAPLKSDLSPPKPTLDELNSGVVDQRLRDISDRRSSASASIVLTVESAGPEDCGRILIEGYLSKFSSGGITSRWQKRYFILKESGLEYFGKESHARASIPGSSVIFPIKRIRSVCIGSSSNELDLVIGRNKRKYSLKAPSIEICNDWVSAITSALSKWSSAQLSLPGSADSIASQMDHDGSDVLAGSSLNDNSSSIDMNTSLGTGGLPGVWEQPDISSEEIDALFSEWFIFLDDSRTEVKAGRMIDAGSRAASDLWALIGQLPRGEDVSFDDSRTKMEEQLTKTGESQKRAELLTQEYVVRLSSKVTIWLERRPANIDDIPVVLEWICRLERNLQALLVVERSWQKSIKQLIRSLASDWEVCLIELLNFSGMASEAVWDLPEVQSMGKLTTRPHGPSKTLVFGKPALITSWTLQYQETLNEKCLGRKSNRGTPWKVAFPTCAHILTTHASSALVASLNACWREFKRRSALLASYKSSTVGSMMKRMKRITGRLSVMSPKADEKDRPATPPGKHVNRELGNMMAFANEATVMSVFCQLTSTDSPFSSSSQAFGACLEGLSSNFASIASEVARSIVKMHFLKKNHRLIMSAFDPKQLAVRVKIPIAETLEVGKKFIENLPDIGCHELLRYLVIGQVMQGIANAYITSLVRHRPRISKFARLAAVVAEDEGLFFSMFRELGRPVTEINSAIDQISHARAVLAEPNLTPPAKGGLPLVQECVELTKAFPSSQRAIEVVKAILEIKGVPKQDRKDIVFSVAECVQRNVNSPSPGMLDLSKEDEDDDYHPDDSGFSSRHSGKAGDDSP